MKRLFAVLAVVAVGIALVGQPAWAAPARAVAWGPRVGSRAAAPAAGVPTAQSALPDLTRAFTALATTRSSAMPVEGMWVVGLDHTSSRAQASAARQAEALGAQVDTRSPAGDALVVSPGPGVAGAAVVESLRDAPGVRYVEPVVARHITTGFTATDAMLGARAPTDVPAGGVRVSLIPTDPAYAGQWGLPRIGAPTAWDITEGSRETTIAIIDTGVDYSQPDLAGRIDTVDARNFSVSPATSNADDDSWKGLGAGHGTHVAGIAAAALNNAYAGAGVAPNCTILPVKVFDLNGNGDSYKAGLGVRWAADHGASVINMSYGGSDYTQFEADSIAYALGKGCVLVAAAGNNGTDFPEYPAAFPGVLAVSALTHPDGIASYSNVGGDVDLAAPGSDIVSLAPVESGLETMTLSGTSMASPFVAGSAALVRSATPTMTSVETVQQLVDTAEDLGPTGWDPWYGAGVVRADLALGPRPAAPVVTYPDLGGADRYETAVKIAGKAFPSGASSVLIATGDNYPDALGASALAGAYRAPILLVPTKGPVPKAVTDEIKTLGCRRVIILGGTGAVTNASVIAVAAALVATHPRPVRLGGADRYATALLVARATKAAIGSSAWARQAFVVTGTSFADALTVAPIAYRAGVPVLLAPTTKTGWAALDTALGASDLDVGQILIVGAEDRVPASAEDNLAALPGVTYIGRLGAPVGLASSLLVGNLAREYGMSFDHVAFASSVKFPDGLTGGPLQGEQGSFILLVPGTSLPDTARWELATHHKEISEVDFLGGTGVMTPALRGQVASTFSK